MRLLHLIGSMNPLSGGPCEGLRNTIPLLEKLGVYQEVVSLDDPKTLSQINDSFPIHALGPTRTNWCYSKKLSPWLIKNLERFDIIIVNGLWLSHGFAAKKALQRLRKKLRGNDSEGRLPRLFIMPHGMLDPYFQKATHRRIKALRNWIYWKTIESNIVNNAEGILFTCETELRLAKLSFRPYHPKREYNIGYGILKPPSFDLQMVHSFYDKCPGVKGSNYLLYLSRIHHKKGVDLLITAYQKLLEEGRIEKKLLPKLVIAGPGIKTSFGQSIRHMIDNSPYLRDNVFLPGMLSGNEKWGAFYGCEAFVLPSHQENFGIAVVEALACNKPVLISNQVNIANEVAAENAGIIGDDSLQGTREILQLWLLKSPEEREIMGEKAFQTYLHHFSMEQSVQRFLKSVLVQN